MPNWRSTWLTRPVLAWICIPQSATSSCLIARISIVRISKHRLSGLGTAGIRWCDVVNAMTMDAQARGWMSSKCTGDCVSFCIHCGGNVQSDAVAGIHACRQSTTRRSPTWGHRVARPMGRRVGTGTDNNNCRYMRAFNFYNMLTTAKQKLHNIPD